jgi:hypothetical protein
MSDMQRRAEAFARKLAGGPGVSNEVVLDELVSKAPRTESERHQSDGRLAVAGRKVKGPQAGPKAKR